MKLFIIIIIVWISVHLQTTRAADIT